VTLADVAPALQARSEDAEPVSALVDPVSGISAVAFVVGLPAVGMELTGLFDVPGTVVAGAHAARVVARMLKAITKI
jgi:hypothetical protein